MNPCFYLLSSSIVFFLRIPGKRIYTVSHPMHCLLKCNTNALVCTLSSNACHLLGLNRSYSGHIWLRPSVQRSRSLSSKRNKAVSLFFLKMLKHPPRQFMRGARLRGTWRRKRAFQHFFPDFLPLRLPTCEVSLCHRTTSPDCWGSSEPRRSVENRAGRRVEWRPSVNKKN